MKIDLKALLRKLFVWGAKKGKEELEAELERRVQAEVNKRLHSDDPPPTKSVAPPSRH